MKKKYWGIVVLALALFGIAYEGLQPRKPADAAAPLEPMGAKGSRKNNFTFCCRLSGLRNTPYNRIGICNPESRQPFGARRRTGICGVAAPRRCHHIACVAAPGICPPGARAKM